MVSIEGDERLVAPKVFHQRYMRARHSEAAVGIDRDVAGDDVARPGAAVPG